VHGRGVDHHLAAVADAELLGVAVRGHHV